MNTRKRMRFFGLAVFLAAAARPLAQDAGSPAGPYSYEFDYESGSVGAWSSYPPAQDTAYDPTIWVKKLPGNPGLALVREIRPNYPIDYVFGVRKKLDLLVDKDSRIAFRFYVRNFGKTEAVIVKLALADGVSREIRVPAGQNGAWHEAEVSPVDPFAPAGQVRLDAVGFMASCVKADPEADLWFAVDDVRVTGWRSRPADIQVPGVHWLEEWSAYIAGKHFEEGQPLEFRGAFAAKPGAATVRLAGLLPEREPFAVPLRTEGLTFSGRVPGDRIRPGLWRAEFSHGSTGGKSRPTALYFLVRPKTSPAAHPLLFLTEEEKARAAAFIREGRGREIWQKLQESARDFRTRYNTADFEFNLDAYDEVFWLPTYHGYANTIRGLSGFARATGFVYALGGDKEAGQAAKQALLKMISWPTFVHQHILNQGQFTYWPVGLVILDLAVAYDLIYDLLTPAEREAVAAALYHKGISGIFKEYVRDNRVSSNTSNWISHVTGGGILGAIAVEGELKEADLEPYLTGMILKVAELARCTFDRDGNYGEGYGYHNFTMQTMSEIMPVLKAHFGIEFPEKVLRSHLYLPYQLNPKAKRVSDFGDTGARLIPMSNFAYILHEGQDPLLKWLYGLAPGSAEPDLVFGDESVRPEPPGTRLPPVRLFRDVGTAVFRSGFSPDDFSFVFRAGPFYNHQHFDQGSFYLSDRGEDFIVEGGRTDYYNDPWYQGFFIQPGAHNCILVDGNVESQRAGDLLDDVPAWQDFARITDFLDFEEGAFLSAELAPIYKGKFGTLRRAVLFLKPRTVVLIDSGSGGRDAGRVDLRFHAPLKDDIRAEGQAARIHRGGNELSLRTLYPRDAGSEVRKRPLSLDEFKSENALTMKARGFLEVSTALRDGAFQLVNVISTDGRLAAGASLADRGKYLELAVDGRRFLVRRVEGGQFEAEGWLVDADLFSESQGTIRALRVSEIRTGADLVFRADSPVSLAVEAGERPATLLIWAAKESTVQIACSSRPARIEREGRRLEGWTWSKGILTLKVPKEFSKTGLIY